jgi:RNA polymerase sigma-70 factor (ECF subfamily)
MQAFAAKFTDRATAEDLVQDVFMRIWVSRETSPINESLQAYLFRAVRNRCINHLEHLKVKANYETQAMVELQIREAGFFQSPEQLLIRQEQLEQVFHEIEKLPETGEITLQNSGYGEFALMAALVRKNLKIKVIETCLDKWEIARNCASVPDNLVYVHKIDNYANV